MNAMKICLTVAFISANSMACTIRDYFDKSERLYKVQADASPEARFALTSYLFYQSRGEELRSEYDKLSRWSILKRSAQFKKIAEYRDMETKYWGMLLVNNETSPKLLVLLDAKSDCLGAALKKSSVEDLQKSFDELLALGDSDARQFIKERFQEDLARLTAQHVSMANAPF